MRKVKEEREFKGARAADGEGFDDELAAEFDALNVGAGFEGDVGCGGFRGLIVVGMLVFLLLVAALLLLGVLFSLLH